MSGPKFVAAATLHMPPKLQLIRERGKTAGGTARSSRHCQAVLGKEAFGSGTTAATTMVLEVGSKLSAAIHVKHLI